MTRILENGTKNDVTGKEDRRTVKAGSSLSFFASYFCIHPRFEFLKRKPDEKPPVSRARVRKVLSLYFSSFLGNQASSIASCALIPLPLDFPNQRPLYVHKRPFTKVLQEGLQNVASWDSHG